VRDEGAAPRGGTRGHGYFDAERHRILLLPVRHSPRLGLAGAFGWAMPPWRRIERVRELAASLGAERTAVLSGLTPAQVLEIQERP
jgi:hypothetical protein